MLVSIVTIVRNDRHGLATTQASIEAQLFRDFEWLVIDGASDDGTAEDVLAITSPYAQSISEPDTGIFDAMNKGLNSAKGKFVLFLNAGDIFPNSSTLAMIAPLLERNDVSFLFGDSFEKYAGNTREYKRARKQEKIAYGMFGCHQAMYYRRGVIGEMRYNTRFEIAGDYDFTVRFLNKTNQVLKVSDALCVFDLKGISNNHREKGRRENWIVQRDVLMLTLTRRLLNQVIYHLSNFISHRLPSLYKIVRYRATKD